MTRFDLHPEDLLERADRGLLSDAELTRLSQHLAECAVCRVERALKQQAMLDAEPLRDEKLMLARLKRDVGQRARGARGRTRRKGAIVAVSLVAASLASVAAAATVVIVRRAQAPELSAPVEATPVAPTPGKSKQASALATREQPAEVAAPEPEATEPAAEVAPKPPAVDSGSASELFSRANQARRAGKVKEAVHLYRALQERFSGSGEELVSRVALGRLLLDRLGDSRGALVQFNSYLASPGSGALREEAMVGRALSLGRIGRVAEERAAWRALLDTFPKSTQAKRAQARLAELEQKPGSAPR